VKILHVETGRHLYGGALQVLFLLEGLKQRGIDSVLVCTKGSEIARQARPYALVRELPMYGEADIIFPLRLSTVIRETTPDLVHVHSRRGADIWGGVCARFHHIPGLITRRVDNREWPPIARLKYGSYDRIVTISQGIRQVLLEEGIAPDRVRCVRSAVDVEHYRIERDREWFQGEFGVSASAPLIGVIAQLIPRKGHRYLLEITPELLSRFPDLRIVFFGQGPLEAELRESIRRLGLEERVQLAGFRNDMPRILPCLDLVVHPALMEGLGVSLLQAAACGVPLVAARAGGIPEVVRHGESGYLVEPGSSRDLKETIASLLADPELGRRFGSQGRRIVEQEFSIDGMVEENVSIYEGLLNKRKR
jgi:glycosyltransferase involved in cell wall biosynthesis